MEMVRRTVLKSVVVLMAAAFLASCDPFGLRDVLKAASRAALSLDPTDVTVPAGATVTFTAEGGVPPYSWSVSSGLGSIDADTGEYLAPLSMGSAVVRVTDAAGVTAETGVIIEDLLTGLNVTPSALTVTVNGDVQFAAIGGTGSYTWDFASEGSGSPDINPATGYYVAGSFPGTDVVRVSDGMSPPATATVTVVALSSAVDYTVTSTGGLPSSGEAGTAIGGGVTFTLANTGAGDGAGTVSWRVYLSDDGTLGGGDVVASEGISGPLAAGGSIEVGLGGSWPNGPVGPGYLIVTVSAADDTSPGNNTAAGSPFTLDPRQVDYDVTAISHDAGTIAGESVDGSFTVENVRSTAGAATLYWFVYASTDTTVDAGDFLLQSGSHTALAPAVPTPIPIASTWPTTPDFYYLLVKVSASDDVDSLNDTGWTTLSIEVTGPPPVDIDYEVDPPTYSGSVAGGTVAGSFDVTNTGTVAGSQTLYWTVYRSPDSSLDPGSDPILAMGSRAGLAVATPTSIGYSGTWPNSAAPWWLFAVVSASDDADTGNNESTSTSVVVTAPNVDYTIQAFTETSSRVAGDPITGTLQVHNSVGGDGGTQTVSWTVYLSEDATLLPAGDLVVDAGTLGPLAAGGSSAVIPFDGTWPVYPSPPWTWRLYLVVDAADEIDPGDNTSGEILRTTSAPNANYDVVSVNGVNGTAGRALTGSFTITNLGPHDGTQAVPWRAYLSTDATWDEGIDTLVDSDIIASPGLPASTPMGPLPIDGTWPVQPGSWYLIVVLDAGDDQTPGNDWAASGLLTASAPNVDYIVPTVTLNAGLWIPDKPVSGTFRYRNNGSQGGSPTQTVSWEVFASTNPTIDGDDALIDSYTGDPALGPSTTSGDVAWAGVWPLTYGNYYILVRVSCAEDILNLNNVGSTAAPQTIGVYNAESAEPNNDFSLLTDPMPLDITLRPGMAVMVTGTMANADRDDIFEFNTGTASRVVVTIDWGIIAPNVRIYLWGGPGLLLKGVSGLSGSMSLDWEVDLPGTLRWINVDNYWSGTDYTPPPNPVFLSYTCWIVAY